MSEIIVKVWVNYGEGMVEEVFFFNVIEKRMIWGEWEYDEELLYYKYLKLYYI